MIQIDRDNDGVQIGGGPPWRQPIKPEVLKRDPSDFKGFEQGLNRIFTIVPDRPIGDS